jgi:CDP-4-dehydro-6-deoxyglucose reductase/ferredoxin-NAD(P)+ reductase (naphthalene dioxygenase ferredoxin-specific)
VPLLHVEGEAAPLVAEEGETVLAALKRHGLPAAYSCEAGNCGTCKVEYLGGEIFELDRSEYALSPALRARNVVLACRTQVWGDVTIRQIDADELTEHPSRLLTTRVVALDALTHDVRLLRLAIEAGGPFDFSAGQYARLEFARGVARDYSMANAPGEEVLEFHIRLAGGAGSRYVAERLATGDRVIVEGPKGASYWRERHRGPMLLIAGGTGLAPVLSIARAALRAGRTEPMRLYFGVRAERDVYFEAVLAQLAARHPNFAYDIVLSEADGACARRTGQVTDAVAEDYPSFEGVKVYAAGPPPMVAAATALATARGLPLRDLHADAFITEAERGVGSGSAV